LLRELDNCHEERLRLSAPSFVRCDSPFVLRDVNFVPPLLDDSSPFVVPLVG